jgi:protein phosphatase
VATGRTTLRISYGSATHVGKQRSLNEDAYLVAPPVFMVADGMGGHASGEIASALAVEAMAVLGGQRNLGLSAIRGAVGRANASVYERSSREGRVMGTTLSGLVLASSQSGGDVVVVNVGDSRTYLLRHGALRQITTDHSHVQELIESGVITPADVAHHPDRNIVTRALGIEATVLADITGLTAEVGDRYLVCSDGLTADTDDEAITAALTATDAQEAADRLVTLVLDGRARDNVTVIVVDVVAISDDEGDRTDPRGRRGRVSTHPSDTTDRRGDDDPTGPIKRPDLIDVVPQPGEPRTGRSPRTPVELIDEIPDVTGDARSGRADRGDG